MFGTAVVLYAALACLTVKPALTVYPAEARAAPVVGEKPSQQPAQSLPVVCKQLNELGVQKHPSLNP